MWLEQVWRGESELSEALVVKLGEGLERITLNLEREKKRSQRCLTWQKVRDFVDTNGEPVLWQAAMALDRRLAYWRGEGTRRVNKKFVADREALLAAVRGRG